ncbi:hypothetical protein HUT18_20370 [Streptomyces sp. NA04227]|uniref:hypothetical protein n=1 Tax=Streptomyces sp. NA04227 TaxID=2742136 RepID=UPI001592424C|nr:hypothetical protein [Streptomyces sp. NA04227]QKW08375.1 hypothetical protein HUT18_20370 [Streptomyces sp. NA04227]
MSQLLPSAPVAWTHRIPGWLRGVLVTVAAVLALAGVVALGRWCEGVWVGEPYPEADPATTALRLDDHTQTVYESLDLPHARLDTGWSGQGAEAYGDSCHRRGLRNWEDSWSTYPHYEPHVVQVHNKWALEGVSQAAAVTAAERVREDLTRQGWRTVSYGGGHLSLTMESPESGDTINVESYAGGPLVISAAAECARYPASTAVDGYGDPVLPNPTAPKQLR